jgi:hypothetical protein
LVLFDLAICNAKLIVGKNSNRVLFFGMKRRNATQIWNSKGLGRAISTLQRKVIRCVPAQTALSGRTDATQSKTQHFHLCHIRSSAAFTE